MGPKGFFRPALPPILRAAPLESIGAYSAEGSQMYLEHFSARDVNLGENFGLIPGGRKGRRVRSSAM